MALDKLHKFQHDVKIFSTLKKQTNKKRQVLAFRIREKSLKMQIKDYFLTQRPK